MELEPQEDVGFPHRCLGYRGLGEGRWLWTRQGALGLPIADALPWPCPQAGPEKSFPPRQQPGPSRASHSPHGKVSGSVSPGPPRGGFSCVLLPWAGRLQLPAELDVTLCASTATLGFGRIPSLFVLQTPTYGLKLGSLKSQLPIGL